MVLPPWQIVQPNRFCALSFFSLEFQVLTAYAVSLCVGLIEMKKFTEFESAQRGRAATKKNEGTQKRN
jgi:hypothetical protein